jgi:hypothetical protein
MISSLNNLRDIYPDSKVGNVSAPPTPPAEESNPVSEARPASEALNANPSSVDSQPDASASVTAGQASFANQAAGLESSETSFGLGQAPAAPPVDLNTPFNF